MSLPLRSVFVRLLVEDDGQDLIEYSLLTLIITVASIATLTTLRTHMGTAYVAWCTQILDNWVPSVPVG